MLAVGQGWLTRHQPWPGSFPHPTRSPAMQRLLRPRRGTPARCRATCGTETGGISARPARSWSSTRPAMSRRAPRRSGCSAIHRNGRADRDAQVAVYLTYASAKGHALMDRALYLPDAGPLTAIACRSGRARARRVRDQPALAQAMITGALAAGVPASWVAGDEVYGADSKLRKHLRGRHRICPGRRQEPSGRHRDRARRAIDLAAGCRALLAAHVCRPGLKGRTVV